MDKNPLKAFRMHTSSPTVVVNGVDYDEQYAVNATIGGQNFSVIVDTASWVLRHFVVGLPVIFVTGPIFGLPRKISSASTKQGGE